MAFLSLLVASAAMSLAVSSPALAQTAASDATEHVASQSTDQEAKELQLWIDEFTAWKEWWAQWANRPQPGWLSSSRPRREKPAPPAWLAERCEAVFVETDPLQPACALLEEWRTSNMTTAIHNKQSTVVLGKEEREKKTWWEHIHIDALWPATELRNNVYGVIGVHPAMTVKGRLQVFLSPGVMLLNLPTADARRTWKFATNYGVGYRLANFKFPGGRRAALHVNIAKSWLVSDTRDLLVSRNLDFAGFSITFRR